MSPTGLKRRREAKKEALQDNDFKLKWFPQRRQLVFLKAAGLDYIFPAFIDENKEGQPVIYKRKNRPKDIQPPKAKVIGYGGAAGGGKTDAMLMAMFSGIMARPGMKCGFFRRKFTQLDGVGGAIARSREIFNEFPGAKYNKNDKQWTFHNQNEAVLAFKHINTEDDIHDYQSQQFDIVAFDEATQFTKRMYMYLATRNRATVRDFNPIMLLGTNPGGVGHLWFKQHFIDIGPPEVPQDVVINPEKNKKRKHIFIPAKLEDNIILEDRDPEYRNNLEIQSEIDRKRLLDGDWDIYEGQFFKEYSSRIHDVKDFEIPDWWKRFISIDYGLDMAAVYWYALNDLGIYYVYKEMHIPNVSLNELAKEIRKRTSPIERDALAYTVAPPDLFDHRQQQTGKTGRQILVERGLSGYGLRKADNSRVEGWRVVRDYLEPIPDPVNEGETIARVMFFENAIRKLTAHLPLLQHDDNNPDDVANDPHEITHGPDSLRYFLMSRPPIKSLTEKQREKQKERKKERAKPLYESTGY